MSNDSNSKKIGQSSDSDEFSMPLAPPPPPSRAATPVSESSRPLASIAMRDAPEVQISKPEVNHTAGGTIPGEERRFYLNKSEEIQMCWIPSGEFLMGSPPGEPYRSADEYQHLVKILNGFWMSKYPVTQGQWFSVMGNRPSVYGNRCELINMLLGESKEQWKALPVENVSWTNICGNRSLQSDGFLDKANSTTPIGWCFKLPSETEWEYACRAGTTTAFNNGERLARFSLWSGNLSKLGWYEMNSGDKPHPVGQKAPNAWGLHDMHGNVWEWCSSCFSKYPEVVTTDSLDPPVGLTRVNRGGSWASRPKNCRSASRSSNEPDYKSKRLGFRLVLCPH